jgi:hypothetical protein
VLGDDAVPLGLGMNNAKDSGLLLEWIPSATIEIFKSVLREPEPHGLGVDNFFLNGFLLQN